MRRFVIVGCALLSMGSDCKKGPSKPGPHPKAAEALDAAPPPVALLATHRTRTDLFFAVPGADLDPAAASFVHLDGGDVRGAVLADGRVAVTAPALPGRDRSFDSGLWILEPGSEAQLVTTGVAHASAPLALADGRVVVARGEAGEVAAHGRIDALGIDVLDPFAGTLDRLYAWDGYLLHLAGTFEDEALVYRVGAGGADLVAVDLDDGGVRLVLEDLPPYARDFSVDDARLVFRGRDESDARTWVVDAVDLRSGERRRLHTSRTFALAPHVWPDGGVALSEGEDGLVLLESPDPVSRPLGAGVDLVRDVSDDGLFVAVLHTSPGHMPVPFVLDRAAGDTHRVPVPPGARASLAGFAEP
jgi:hypothetical protein